MTEEEITAKLNRLAATAPTTGTYWRNKKTGKKYEVVGYGLHSETLEEMVAYRSATVVTDTAVVTALNQWYRPLPLFFEKFEAWTDPPTATKEEIDRQADKMIEGLTCRYCCRTGQAYTRHKDFVGKSVEVVEGVIHTRQYICGNCHGVSLCGVNENKGRW